VTAGKRFGILDDGINSFRRGYSLRVRITQQLRGSVDGVDLARFLEGLAYDVGTTLGNYLLAQQWAEPASQAEPAAIIPLHTTVRRPSVLIVDDDDDMRRIVRQLLGHHGWEVYEAPDGTAGLEALQKHRPSLIVLDLAMPRMNGIEFRRRQRELPDKRLANVPVVVVSAMADAPHCKSTLRAVDVLVKPFDADRLLQSVENHVRPVSLLRG
jgi:two-component system, chemotaxis family, chemotaxis protein CheY